MTTLWFGLVLFLGAHSVAILAPTWRARSIERFGPSGWKVGYSIVSAAGLVLLLVGHGMARGLGPTLYQPPVGLRHLALLLMLPVFPLLFATYLPGRLSRAARHPMLLAVGLWALAHLLANGSPADVALFGAFLVWAVADRISVQRRGAGAPPGAPPHPRNDAVAVLAGLATYAFMLAWGHRWLIGVSPLG